MIGTSEKGLSKQLIQSNIILNEVHCPFCQNKDAFLISQFAKKKMNIFAPALSMKTFLRLFFSFGLYIFSMRMPLYEHVNSYQYSTYGFCPKCGKKYDASSPHSNDKIEAYEEGKVYKSRKEKKIFGVCGGIAEYTGFSTKAVRFVMFFHAWWLYIPCAIALSFNPEHGE